MNTETQLSAQALQTKALMLTGSIDEMVEAQNVSAWLLGAALREVQRLEGKDMTEASALLQALSDRLQDCSTIYFAQNTARELLAGLGGKEIEHE